MCKSHYNLALYRKNNPPKFKARHCSRSGCARPPTAKGLCTAHYQRMRRAAIKARNLKAFQDEHGTASKIAVVSVTTPANTMVAPNPVFTSPVPAPPKSSDPADPYQPVADSDLANEQAVWEELYPGIPYNKGAPRGKAGALLGDFEVRQIRKDRRGVRKIAEEYGISDKTVRGIKSGELFSDIEDLPECTVRGCERARDRDGLCWLHRDAMDSMV